MINRQTYIVRVLLKQVAILDIVFSVCLFYFIVMLPGGLSGFYTANRFEPTI